MKPPFGSVYQASSVNASSATIDEAHGSLVTAGPAQGQWAPVGPLVSVSIVSRKALEMTAFSEAALSVLRSTRLTVSVAPRPIMLCGCSTTPTGAADWA